MPTAPLRPCRWPGCPALVERGYCARHQPPAEERKSAAQRGYDARWRTASKAFLREHPLCAACLKQGRGTTARVVDHVVPHRGDMGLFWNRNNWQALCKPCHDRKTAAEDGGFGRRKR